MRTVTDTQEGNDDLWRTDLARRVFDVIMSGVLIVTTAPIVIILAIASAISFRAGPIFFQERVGKGGENFCCWKIRTLPTSVPLFTDKFDLANYEISTFWRIVRRRHLDELPQLVLVFIGRMSMVGPRPEMQYLHDGMDTRFRGLRTSVRPGCTGLWQVSEGSAGLITASPKYDSFYIEHRSLRFDLWISLHTARTMLGIGSPIGLDDIPDWVTPRTGIAADRRVIIDLRDRAPERVSVDARP